MTWKPSQPKAPVWVILGPLPPPVTGAALNTKHMLDALTTNGARVTPISTAVQLKRESSGPLYHVYRFRRVFEVLRAMLLARKPPSNLYVVPDAGLGAWYTLLYLVVGYAVFDRIVFQHHSFRYINHTSLAMKLMVNLTRDRALHVFLSDSMRTAFCSRYGGAEALVSGNAVFVRAISKAVAKSRTDGTIILGHLSNLRRNKGFFAAAEVFERLAREGVPVRLHLAGPITENGVESRLAELTREFGDRIRWIGPVAGDAKTDFYRNLDVFLFATTHPQEAQPNVIYEAHSAGVPVLATPRACIPEMLDGLHSICSPDEPSFVEFAVSTLRTMSFDEEVATSRRIAILTRLQTESLRAQEQYRELLRAMGVHSEPVELPWC
jgi:glycosyltransferase involved in cell wall biosynthesis